jgi:uncharacterized protein with HEPN domain
MPKRGVEFFIIDILLAIYNVKKISAKMKTAHSFEKNRIAYSAIMHELEIIGEAMKYILTSQSLQPHVKPDWKKIIAFRNIIAHEYFGISSEDVFSIIKDNIPELEQDFIELIRKIDDTSDISFTISAACKDFQKKGWRSEVLYLTKLSKSLRLDK